MTAQSNADRRDPPLPLSRHVFLDCDDPALATERVSQIFAPHTNEVRDREAPFRSVHHHARLRRLSFNFIRYQPAVAIRSGPTRHYYLILVPQAGACTVGYGPRTVTVGPGQLTVVNPLEPLTLDWGDGCAQLVLKVERSQIEDHLSERLGRSIGEPVLFDFDRAIPVPECRSFVDLFMVICADLDRDKPVLTAPAAEAHTEALCLAALLADLPHSHRSLLAKPQSRAAPYYVKRVEELIELHAERPLTVADMVSVAGVSARSLFNGFRDFRGMGPKAYLKAVRLDRVHADLRAAGGRRITVAEVATSWGFRHLGNFARDYKARFGEAPSESLRSARTSPARKG